MRGIRAQSFSISSSNESDSHHTCEVLRRMSFELRYRLGCPRWDTGVTPPELRAFVEDEHRAPGRALDLGCGTGTNIVYLARHGWDAVGVDFVRRAVALARRRAADSHLAQARFIVGDVTRLPRLGNPFDLALDIGCLHSIAQDARGAYASSLVAQLRPGATYLLYAFSPPAQLGIARRDVEALFSPALTLVSYLEGTGRPSAWYRFSYA